MSTYRRHILAIKTSWKKQETLEKRQTARPTTRFTIPTKKSEYKRQFPVRDIPSPQATNIVSKIITREEERITKTIKIEATAVDVEITRAGAKTALKTAMLEAKEKYVLAVKAMVEANHVYLQRLEEWKTNDNLEESLKSSAKDLA